MHPPPAVHHTHPTAPTPTTPDKVDFDCATLRDVDFTAAKLHGASVQDNDATGAIFNLADVSHVHFVGVVLSHSEAHSNPRCTHPTRLPHVLRMFRCSSAGRT